MVVGLASRTGADASAIGTTVLQLKDIPVRPAEYDGAVMIFDVEQNVDEKKLLAALEKFGRVAKCAFDRSHTPPVIVHFETHQAALDAVCAPPRGICKAIDMYYNTRSCAPRRARRTTGRPSPPPPPLPPPLPTPALPAELPLPC